jgi:hypothetical protein
MEDAMRIGMMLLKVLGYLVTIAAGFLGIAYAPYWVDKQLVASQDPHEHMFVWIVIACWVLTVFILVMLYLFTKTLGASMFGAWLCALVMLGGVCSFWSDHLARTKAWEGQCDYVGPAMLKDHKGSYVAVAIDCPGGKRIYDDKSVLNASIGKVPSYIHCVRFANGDSKCDAE